MRKGLFGFDGVPLFVIMVCNCEIKKLELKYGVEFIRWAE